MGINWNPVKIEDNIRVNDLYNTIIATNNHSAPSAGRYTLDFTWTAAAASHQYLVVFFYESGFGDTDATLDNITLTSESAATSEPTIDASNYEFYQRIGSSEMTVNWTSGNGAKRIVVCREGSAVNADPSDNSTYTASSDWNSKGTQIGTGNYVVYNGTGSSVTLTNLSGSYHLSFCSI